MVPFILLILGIKVKSGKVRQELARKKFIERLIESGV